MQQDAVVAKICVRCGIEKELSEFNNDRTKKHGKRNICRKCQSEYMAGLYADPEKREHKKAIGREYSRCPKVKAARKEYNQRSDVKERRRAGRKPDKVKNRVYLLRGKFGMTMQQYDEMLAAQGGCCAICKDSQPGGPHKTHFMIDHDHGTGEVRGLLCSRCNTGLGQFRDNPKLLKAAIHYLQSTKRCCGIRIRR